jgi:hypothetical protein
MPPRGGPAQRGGWRRHRAVTVAAVRCLRCMTYGQRPAAIIPGAREIRPCPGLSRRDSGHMTMNFVHPAPADGTSRPPSHTVQPGSATHPIDWHAARRADRACCCIVRPVVIVLMPPTAGRPHRTELLLCRHHYQLSKRALAADATVLDLNGVPAPASESDQQRGVTPCRRVRATTSWLGSRSKAGRAWLPRCPPGSPRQAPRSLSWSVRGKGSECPSGKRHLRSPRPSTSPGESSRPARGGSEYLPR